MDDETLFGPNITLTGGPAPVRAYGGEWRNDELVDRG